MTDSLLTEWGEHDVLTLTLNRPERRNALDPELLIALAESLDSHGDRARAVILRGAGDEAFSAGYDLSRLAGTPADLEADRFIGEAVHALRQCPAPVIGRLTGHCHGAGVELALNCDLRIASPTLRMSVPAVSLGVVYRYQFVARLVQTCGIARTADLLLAMAELEAEGVRRVWVIDSQLAMKDVYAGLVVAALNTTRIGLGTGVTNAVTRHPTVTANAISAIAELSHGRAILGLGAGDSALYGVGLKPQKVAELEQAIGFFRAHVDKSIPIYVAVSQERMCDLAGRQADGAIVMGPAQPDMVRRQVEWIEGGLKAAGRRREEIEIELMATVAPSPEDVRSWASTQARLLGHYRDLPESLLRFRDEIAASAESSDFAEHLSTRATPSGAVSDDLVRALAIVGTPEECVERLRGVQGTAIDSLIFPLAGRGRLERWRKIRDEILGQIIV